ncbi:MAG: TonB-dependent receptor, partial [Luteimonas sp.]
VGTRSAAAYGDLTVDFSDRFSLEAGLRYTSETKTGTVFNQGYTDATFTTPTGFVAADFTDSKTFNAWSPRLNLSWRPSEDMLLYVQASRGFKSGSYNIRANTRFVPGSDRPYKDEVATSYELGAKTQWRDGRLTLNAALFHTDYRDLQLSVAVKVDTDGDGIKDTLFGDFKNAGAATIDGAEFELAAQTGHHFKWLANVGYLHARYDEYISDGVNIADSQQLVDAPRWTGGLSAIAEVPLGAAGSVVARVDGHYQSKLYYSTEPDDGVAQDGYTLWNASLTYRPQQQHWQLALFGQNLGNKSYRTSGNSAPLIGYYGPPRTVWLSLSWFF